MSKALKAINHKNALATEQGKPTQVKNNGGGYSFKVDDWSRLERFLILGTDGGTYYVGQNDLTKQNTDFVNVLLKKDAAEVLRRTVDVSDKGRARFNSQALYVLAAAMNTEGVDKASVKSAVAKVARTSTHLFEYAQYLENLGGWGRAKRESIANWYTEKSDDQLALQLVKYRQRNGWTHRDMMRLAHPKGMSQVLGNFALGKALDGPVPAILEGYLKVQEAKTAKEVVALVLEYRLPWETVPTEWHKDLSVWRALFEAGMGQTALIRNVTRFARLNAFSDLIFAKQYADKLANAESIRKGRIHPIAFLNASIVHERGQLKTITEHGYGYKHLSKDWTTNPKVLKALQDGFYAAFGNIEPANKRTMVALDVSGSMGSYANGMDLTCAEVGAAISMFILRSEPYTEIRGFSSSFVDLGLTENDSFKQVLAKTNRMNFGSTNAALPMQHAQKNNQEIDTFVVVTDNEVNTGKQPFRALESYRNATGIPARMAVFGVSASPFTIADPDDKGSLDFVGFDANAPRALADFSAGRL